MKTIITAVTEIDLQIHIGITNFLAEYTNVLDEDNLEIWPHFFIENGSYRILSLENEKQGLIAPILYLYSQGMLFDRITALRDALTYEYLYTRHITSQPLIQKNADNEFSVKSNFSIFTTTESGSTKLFVVGQYKDVIIHIDQGFKFKSRDVILDSFGVPNNISVPL